MSAPAATSNDKPNFLIGYVSVKEHEIDELAEALEIDPKSPLAHGAYGVIYKTCKPLLIAKVQQITNTSSPQNLLQLDLEQKIHRIASEQISHTPSLFLNYQWNRSVFISVMENVGDDLHTKCCKDVFELHKIEAIAKRALEALKAMHALGWAHYDVTLANMGEKHLFDFGLSDLVPPKDPTRLVTARPQRAPEVMIGRTYGRKADIWSLGTCLFQLATKEPFCEIHDNYFDEKRKNKESAPINPKEDYTYLTLYQIRILLQRLGAFHVNEPWILPESGQVLRETLLARKSTDPFNAGPSTKNITSLASMAFFETDKQKKIFYNLLQKMLVYDPAKRISAEAALRHEFFTNSDHVDLQFTLENNLPSEEGFLEIASTLDVEKIPLVFLRRRECIHVSTDDSEVSFTIIKNETTLGPITKNITEGGIVSLTIEEFTSQNDPKNNSSPSPKIVVDSTNDIPSDSSESA